METIRDALRYLGAGDGTRLLGQESEMSGMAGFTEARRLPAIAGVLSLALIAGGCSMGTLSSPFSSEPAVAPEPPPAPELPATIRSEEIVGRWGLASYQNPNDRPRTEAAARGQCKQPYVIGQGASGGVIMHLADEPKPQELRLKGSPNGKNYIGPPGPAGGDRDREIISFDGRVMVTRFVEKDTGVRYGNMVYVRCAPRA